MFYALVDVILIILALFLENTEHQVFLPAAEHQHQQNKRKKNIWTNFLQ